MSTRSAIIVHTGTHFTGIYSHSDGYPSWTGHILATHFHTLALATALVALGDISGIGPDGTADAYHRDNGRPWKQVQPLELPTAEEVAAAIDHDGHVYLFQNDQWHHNGTPLLEVLNQPDIHAQIISRSPNPAPYPTLSQRLALFSQPPSTPSPLPSALDVQCSTFDVPPTSLPITIIPRTVTKPPVKSLDEVLGTTTTPENILAFTPPAPPLASPPSIIQGHTALKRLQHFLPPQQAKFIRQLMRGEEGQHFITRMMELADQIEAMPHTYQQSSIEDPIVHLHYFYASCDWHITEKDMGGKGEPANGPQHQAFGLCNLGHGAELGYVSLPELFATGHPIELDLHFTPKPLSEVRK